METTGKWSWEGSRTPSLEEIREEVEQFIKDLGALTTPSQRDAINGLAEGLWLKALALDAIAEDSEKPKVGTRCAFSILDSSNSNISRSYKSLGIWPIHTLREQNEEKTNKEIQKRESEKDKIFKTVKPSEVTVDLSKYLK